ncbi:MAG: hypothetical protein KF850_13925 [Labilithrix sp.]|nr:hypothetical protein [Labilithrix sp.]
MKGENYEIDPGGRWAVARVWRRPDLPSADGARDASEMVRHLVALTSKISGLLFDLREAPAVAGPRTVDAMTQLLEAYERASVRIAVVVADDPLKALQFRRLVTTFAPTWGRLDVSLAEAEAWLSRPRKSP